MWWAASSTYYFHPLWRSSPQAMFFRMPDRGRSPRYVRYRKCSVWVLAQSSFIWDRIWAASPCIIDFKSSCSILVSWNLRTTLRAGCYFICKKSDLFTAFTIYFFSCCVLFHYIPPTFLSSYTTISRLRFHNLTARKQPAANIISTLATYFII